MLQSFLWLSVSITQVFNLIEGSLEVKLPTIWTDRKAQPGWRRVREETRTWRKSEEGKIRKKSKSEERRCKCAKKDRKVVKHCVFPTRFVAPEGRKVGSLKWRVRSQLAGWKIKNCTLLWREERFEVKSDKNWQHLSTFGRWDVEKAHAVVTRSTFGSIERCQNTPGPEHFWKLRCRKSARGWGTKHILKSKVAKRSAFGSWDVESMHAVWREAHVQVKMYKAPQHRSTFESWDVEKVRAIEARSTFSSQNVQSTTCSDHFWTSSCRPDVEKLHAIVVRSTFPSQKCKKLRVLS